MGLDVAGHVGAVVVPRGGIGLELSFLRAPWTVLTRSNKQMQYLSSTETRSQLSNDRFGSQPAHEPTIVFCSAVSSALSVSACAGRADKSTCSVGSSWMLNRHPDLHDNQSDQSPG